MAGGGAGGDGGKVRAAPAELDGDQATGHIGDHHGDGERGDATWSFGEEVGVLIFEGFEATDATPDNDSVAIRVGEISEARMVVGHFCGGDGELGKAIGAADIFRIFKKLCGVEVGDFASDLAVVTGDIKLGDAADSADAVGEIFPETMEIEAQWGDRAHSSDNDSSLR